MIEGKCEKCNKKFGAHTQKELENQITIHTITQHKEEKVIFMEHKEDFVCEQLQVWFKNNNIQSWLNKGNNKFTTKLSQKKPDIIIFSEVLGKYIAIEVKIGTKGKDIYDASKIIEYWEEYKNNKIKYFIDDKEIKISSFVVATKNSPLGFLFDNESEKILLDDCKDDNWKYTCKLKGIEPLIEYRRTSDYLRSIWSLWRKKRLKEDAPGIGIIVSNLLNNMTNRPLLFDMQWENQLRGSKWQNRQKII